MGGKLCSTQTRMPREQGRQSRGAMHAPTPNPGQDGLHLCPSTWPPEKHPQATSLASLWPHLSHQVALVVFAVHTLVAKDSAMDAEKAFVTLTVLNILNKAQAFLPFSAHSVVQVRRRGALEVVPGQQVQQQQRVRGWEEATSRPWGQGRGVASVGATHTHLL